MRNSSSPVAWKSPYLVVFYLFRLSVHVAPVVNFCPGQLCQYGSVRIAIFASGSRCRERRLNSGDTHP